ncbi:hypothetical protein LTR08_003630 [Meristemomyces frigidus]|nr:hypothetical protein LTR08_003630 [Meristemomyces frigidus]
MVRNGPSPKRRRTEHGPVSADTILQSNVTMNVFTGLAGRQNRWMALGEGANDGSGGVQTGGVEAGGGKASESGGGQRQRQQRPRENMNMATVDEGDGGEQLFSGAGVPTGTSWSSVANGWAAEPVAPMAVGAIAERAVLPEHDAPDTAASAHAALRTSAPAAPTTAPAQHGRKSLDGIHTHAATRQGLPSPAPSEENTTTTNSPLATEATAPRQPSRPPVWISTSFSHSPLTAPATSAPAFGVQCGVGPQVPLTQLPHLARRSLPGDYAPAVRGSPRVAQNAHVPSPLQRFQPSPLTAGASPGAVPSHPPIQMQMPVQGAPGGGGQWQRSPSIGSSPTARALGPHGQQLQQPQAPTPQTPSLHSFFDPQSLLQTINAQLQLHEQSDPSGTSIRGETGRLCLLREAVHKADFFYIVLSQLSCLRSVDPKSLPTSMSTIHPDAYAYLDALLCPNASLKLPLVKWFADFPRPIMQIYSAPYQGPAYESLVRQVVGFLTQLPRQWGPLLEESRTRLAPPLVQDLTERLQLYSPVLQTTAFRAIARTFWASTPDVEAGIEALVAVHRFDQRTFHPATKRGPGERAKALAGYKIIFDAWHMHDRAAKELLAARVARGEMVGALAPFTTPPSAWMAFGCKPGATQQQAGPGPQGVHQRRQSPQSAQTPTALAPGPATQWRVPRPSAALDTPAMQVPMAAPSPVHQLQQHLQQQSTAFRTFQPPAPAGSTSASASAPPAPPPRASKLLFPRLSDCPRAQPTHPDTARAALHQAHLRSPIPGFAVPQPSAPTLYRHIKVCALSPEVIDKSQPVQSWTFTPGDEMRNVPATKIHPEHRGQPVSVHREGSVTFRLRCCRLNPHVGFPTLGSWVTSECVWPETVYFELNGHALEPRRKLQHGRFLPVDVTAWVREGGNELTVLVNRTSGDVSRLEFAVAVEVVETIGHERVWAGVGGVSAGEALEGIRESLSGSVGVSDAANNNNSAADDDDDDIILTSSTLTLNLLDPMSGARIFDVPVRGASCLHRDAFDLATFLATRARLRPGYPSATDDWRCPICRGDVRPGELVRDGFLVRVREQLELLGALGARAIVVGRDGSWVVREEGEGEGGGGREGAVVIELD